MANITIIAINQTGSPLALGDLNSPDQEIPATGSTVTLTDFNTVGEIRNSSELLAHVQADDVLLNDGSYTLTKTESERLLTPPTLGRGTTQAGKVLVFDPATNSITGSSVLIDSSGNLIAQSGSIQTTTGNLSASIGQYTHLTASFLSASLIEIKPTGSVAHSEGTFYYDESEHTITVMNDESDVRHQLGQEGYIRVRNETGVTITNGDVVYISGSGTGGELRPSVALAQADDVVTSEVIGLATHDIENNTYGYVTYWGKVNDLDTSAFADGDTLRLSDTTPGALTNTSVTAGNYNVIVGYVIHSNATTGSILVSINADLGLGVGDAEELVSTVRKGSAGTLNPGQVVYLSGYNNGQSVAEVELAQADAAATMPSFGILRDTITSITNGTVVNFGRIAGFDTSGFSVGDELYVDPDTAGALTVTKPSGSNLIQKVAKVIRSNASNGILEVFGAGRSNDLPALATDSVWLGNSGSTPVATSRSGIDDTAIHDDVASEISVVTAKGTPVAGDFLIIEDSAAGNVKKSVLWGNITGSGGGLSPHGFADVVNHTASTLAEVNSLITDTNLLGSGSIVSRFGNNEFGGTMPHHSASLGGSDVRFLVEATRNLIPGSKEYVYAGQITASAAATELIKSITIVDPATTEEVAMFYTVDAITLDYLAAVVQGTTPSRTWQIRHSTDRSAAGNAVMSASVATTSTTTGDKVNTFTSGDPTVPANSWVWLDITAGSGTVTEFSLSIRYTID